MPALDFALACDRAFPESNGRFGRLWPLVIKYAYPSWFRPFVAMEAVAAAIRSFEVQLVPGLLQTPGYTRAVLDGARLSAQRAEEILVARLERQRVLTRENPPDLWVVLEEGVLRRKVGGPEVFAAQLTKLLEASEAPSTLIQVIPGEASAHAAMTGAFAVLAMDEGPDVVYEEGFVKGQILADPADVKYALRAYDLLQAVALSPQASLDLIHTTLKELK